MEEQLSNSNAKTIFHMMMRCLLKRFSVHYTITSLLYMYITNENVLMSIFFVQVAYTKQHNNECLWPFYTFI